MNHHSFFKNYHPPELKSNKFSEPPRRIISFHRIPHLHEKSLYVILGIFLFLKYCLAI